MIGMFARHPTAANLLMVLMIVAGLFSLDRINTQFFPDFGLDVITVSVDWPGASASDVDENVIQAIEPEVRFLDGVKEVRADSVEGRGTVTVEFEAGTDMQKALSDVETAVGQVTTLPEEAERPVIKRIVRYDPVTHILLTGPYPERALKAFAEQMRDELLERGVDKVELIGARDEEILVEVAPQTLRRLDLTYADVAGRIGALSQDLPSGNTRGGAERQIRSLGLVKTAEGFRELEIRAEGNGERIVLGDIATVREAFDDTQPTLRVDGRPAIELKVLRAITADALEEAAVVDAYLADVVPALPSNLVVAQYDVTADLVRSRIELLLRNGATGLVLVLGVLFLFLNLRVGFWVAVGIPISLFAAVTFMYLSGQSINMVSLFALIMVIGIIVDDAIVVGEHAESRHRMGLPPVEAAETGARRMAVPVTAASLTTAAAFAPLLLITDNIGKVISAIPQVAMVVIVASLIECFFVLPGHMRSALRAEPPQPRFSPRRRFIRAFEGFRDGPFRRLLAACIRWRYLTLASALAAFIIALGLVAGGRIGFHFFVSPEADKLYANLQMVAGTPRAETAAAIDGLDAALRRAAARLEEQHGTPLLRTTVATVGRSVGRETGGTGAGGDHLGGVTVELVAADERPVRTDAFIEAWRAAFEAPAGLDTLTILPAQTGPPGRDIDIRIRGDDVEAIKRVSEKVKALLASYPGLSAIEDDLPYGKEEAVIEITPRGRALGFTTESVGRQVRNAFEGAIAQRFARDDEEVVVRVRAPEEWRDAAAFHDFFLRGATGAEVPLEEVVSLSSETGFARIRRENGKRQASITAEIDKTVTSTGEVVEALGRDGVAAIAAEHGASISFAGKAEEQQRTFSEMRTGALIGLAVIYIVLSWVFGNYAQPVVVMSIIPLAFVGTAIGHLVMGYDLSILSMVALIGLSGIVINDSIILVTTIREHLDEHEDKYEAVINGTCERLRAVVLTSATTIGGLTPMMFETSLQARFLVPMAVTIVFGLMVTTVLVLVVVPSMLAVIEDAGRAAGRLGLARRRAVFDPDQREG